MDRLRAATRLATADDDASEAAVPQGPPGNETMPSQAASVLKLPLSKEFAVKRSASTDGRPDQASTDDQQGDPDQASTDGRPGPAVEMKVKNKTGDDEEKAQNIEATGADDPLIYDYAALMEREVAIFGRAIWLRSAIRQRSIAVMSESERKKRKF